jgi:hypothetical protein
LAQTEPAVTIETQEDTEPAYGEWHSCTPKDLVAEADVDATDEGQLVEPSWTEGVPTRMRRLCGSPSFSKNGVHHRYRSYYRSVELSWTGGLRLSWLRENPTYLPSSKYSSEWSGVYRLFVEDKTIDRCCGNDTTGTLYIGCAGTKPRKGSILRTRIKHLVGREHHVFARNIVHKKFPWDSLTVQWACTGETLDYKGEDVAQAEFAEAFLLGSYAETFGEYPPWNLRGV